MTQDVTLEEIGSALAKWQANAAGQDPTHLLIHCIAAFKERTGDYQFTPLGAKGRGLVVGKDTISCGRTLKGGGIRTYSVDLNEFPVYRKVSEETSRPRTDPVPIELNALSPALISEVEQFAQAAMELLAKGR